MMASETESLEQIIKRSVAFKIKELEINDVKDEKHLDRLEQLTPNMMVRLRVAPEIGRDMSFTMRLKIEENMTAIRLGTPVEAFPKVQPMEDVTQYIQQTTGFADQILEALNKSLKEKSGQKT